MCRVGCSPPLFFTSVGTERQVLARAVARHSSLCSILSQIPPSVKQVKKSRAGNARQFGSDASFPRTGGSPVKMGNRAGTGCTEWQMHRMVGKGFHGSSPGCISSTLGLWGAGACTQVIWISGSADQRVLRAVLCCSAWALRLAMQRSPLAEPGTTPGMPGTCMW
jgi:hypothetical protein